MKSPAKISENRFLGSISSSSIRNLLPKSISAKPKSNPNHDSKTFRSNDENAVPVDPNVQADQRNATHFTKQSSPKSPSPMSPILKSHGQLEILANLQDRVQVQKTASDTFVEEKEALGSPLKDETRTVLSPRRTNSVPNEISEECEPLGDQIRQLKEELIRTKSDGFKPDGSRNGYFARDSLSQLRVSINQSLVLSCANKDDAEEQEMNLGDSDVRDLSEHIEKLHNSCDGNTRDSIQSSFASASCEAESMSDDEICSEDLEKPKNGALDDAESSGISISLPPPTRVLEEPTFSESPKIRNCRKSVAASTKFLASHKNVSESSNLGNMKQVEQVGTSMSKKFPGPAAESLAASLQRGLQIIDYHQRSSMSNRSSVSFSFEHLTLKPCPEADNLNASVQMLTENKPPEGGLSELLCSSCKQNLGQEVEGGNDATDANMSEKDLKNVCKEQATKIEQLTLLLDQYKKEEEPRKLMKSCDGEDQTEVVKATYFDLNEKEALLKEIAELKSKLQPTKSTENLRSSLLLRSIQMRKSMDATYSSNNDDDLEKERERWTEMESEWISLTDDLRQDIDNHRRHAEDLEMELKQEKRSTEELNDALSRAMIGHSRFIEQYTELQEKYNELAEKHHVTMAGVSDMKKAAARAAAKGRHGKRFAKAFTTELSAIRAEKEKEREMLKKENKGLKAQLRDTAEAVQAAGEVLVRLKEAEQAVQASEERFSVVEEENGKLKKQIEKLKSKHKSEMNTMKQYLAESRLPGSALQPWYKEEEPEPLGPNMSTTTATAMATSTTRTSVSYDDFYEDDQAWRAEFGPIYQDHDHY